MATTSGTIQLGEPIEQGGVVVAPLFPRMQPRAEYLTFEEAAPLGFRISEIDEHGSVPQLLAENPLDASVLLYDDEELLGAKQNRILNLTVLVASRSQTLIPVSCVEQGRWSRRSEHFAPAPSTAYPELRRLKAERLAEAPAAPGTAQAEVWQAVQAKSRRTGVHSATGAQRDIFVRHERELRTMRKAFPLETGQSGVIVAFGSGRLCLDYVSQPSAFARLYPKLLDGVLLDALEHATAEPPSVVTLEEFVAAAGAAPRKRQPSIALGEDLRFTTQELIGSGLELDGELLQLSAFSR